MFLVQFLLLLLSLIFRAVAEDLYYFPYRQKIGFCNKGYTFGSENVLENPWYLLLFIILGLIFILVFLGLLKGLIGLCCSRYIGEYGLGILIDLPRPLDKYQEKEYRDIPVTYDPDGWPVDPNTGQRTVKTMSTKTEFFLNVIFFLAYPLAICLQICGVCCCIKPPEYGVTEQSCYNSLNMVTINERIKRKNNYYKCGQNLDIYRDEDMKEEQDTYYVIDQMKKSQTSLHVGF
ncbi:unnamed protein product [Diabrotica balteata]|uniref:Uncharacterized protein n=1 Tax=Diabrotica balteata TaxID=107213 RepID=A0A9N9T615_DIABA|nr:unnamed protein product [Diabrotica balteata]